MALPRQYPVTPDGRYFVVDGRLWRTSIPALAQERRQELVDQLMKARRQVGVARKAGHAQGERGPVWWTDGAPDFNRKMAADTPYAAWFAALKRMQVG